ncbi:MAG TPA: metallophosphoesterase [Terriglobales bacterium]|nr:metallophosphoesterase [Terriglobales bacterium]
MIRKLVLAALITVGAGTLAFRVSPSPTPTLVQAPAAPQSQIELKLPLEQKSVRFAVIGDNGTGEQPQYDIAAEMEAYENVVHYQFVIMMGDNIYGGHKPKDFERKFETPYKPLLDADVKFYACLGNHDNSDETLYKPFNMNGQRYYTFKKGDVQFFALDSNYMDPTQLDWIQQQLRESNAKWKIAFFHHPLYSDGRFHGPDVDLRNQLMPIFEKYGVNVVMSGHDHVYERFKPESGIYFFLVGNSGELRYHNLRHDSDIMAAGFDTDRTFMLVEIAGDKLYFQTITRTGQTVDSGVLQKQPKPPAENTSNPSQ